MGADERDEFLRAAWLLHVAVQIEARRLVFVGEMGTNVSLAPLWTCSRKGARAFGSAPRNWGKNVTLLASITAEGLGPTVAAEGSTTRQMIKTYMERTLAPTLKTGEKVVRDKQSEHKSARVREK